MITPKFLLAGMAMFYVFTYRGGCVRLQFSIKKPV
jgi:hypothetical protein